MSPTDFFISFHDKLQRESSELQKYTFEKESSYIFINKKSFKLKS